jgi:hypothetical protein
VLWLLLMVSHRLCLTVALNCYRLGIKGVRLGQHCLDHLGTPLAQAEVIPLRPNDIGVTLDLDEEGRMFMLLLGYTI